MPTIDIPPGSMKTIWWHSSWHLRSPGPAARREPSRMVKDMGWLTAGAPAGNRCAPRHGSIRRSRKMPRRLPARQGDIVRGLEGELRG
jgi:hypothetical protein